MYSDWSTSSGGEFGGFPPTECASRSQIRCWSGAAGVGECAVRGEPQRQHRRRLAHGGTPFGARARSRGVDRLSGRTRSPSIAAIAHALDAGRVDFIGGGRRQLELAERLGASVIEGDFPERLGSYPITVDASNNPAGLACALRSTGPDGVCTSIGIYFEPATPVPLFEMYSKGVRFLTGRVHAREAMAPALALIEEGRVFPELITSHLVDWEDAAEALGDLQHKTVISRDSQGPRELAEAPLWAAFRHRPTYRPLDRSQHFRNASQRTHSTALVCVHGQPSAHGEACSQRPKRSGGSAGRRESRSRSFFSYGTRLQQVNVNLIVGSAQTPT